MKFITPEFFPSVKYIIYKLNIIIASKSKKNIVP